MAVMEEKEVEPIVPLNMMIPPEDVRLRIEHIVSYIIKNGKQFEDMVRQKEDEKFSFINEGDPFYPYYQSKLREGRNLPPMLPEAVAKAIEKSSTPLEPPPSYKFTVNPPSINGAALDLVKLTAQYVAKNGRKFLDNLMHREQNNYEYDFLRPQHSLFSYFGQLIDQYTAVLTPSKDLVENLRKETRKSLMDGLTSRVEWYRHEDKIKKAKDEAEEKERIQYAQIDWHDFEIVETVDYQPNEEGNFPPPTTPEEVGARELLLERAEYVNTGREDVEMEIEKISEDAEPESNKQPDMVEETTEEEEEEIINPPLPPPTPKEVRPMLPPLPPQPDKVIIRTDYQPPKSKPAPLKQLYFKTPFDEKVPVSKLEDHMKYSLMDPQHLEQKKLNIERQKADNDVYATSDVGANLKAFARKRPDMFVAGNEELGIGGTQEDNLAPQKETWDGHSSSIESITQKALSKVSMKEQIKQIHRSTGLITDEEKEKIGPSKPKAPMHRPPPPMPQPPIMAPPQNHPPPGMMQMPPMQPSYPPMPTMPMHLSHPPPMPMPPFYNEEPNAKRMKMGLSLIPEDQFLGMYPSPVTFHIQTPSVADKSEWKLFGQQLSLCFPLSDTVAAVKAKIHQETNLPPGKQKLSFNGTFIKDSSSLAFCNVTPGSSILLQLKERGGRKK